MKNKINVWIVFINNCSLEKSELGLFGEAGHINHYEIMKLLNELKSMEN